MHRLPEGPQTSVSVNKDEALTYYKQMLAIRRLEAASGAMYKEKAIRGFCHLYSGQEACAVGMKAALRSYDDVITGEEQSLLLLIDVNNSRDIEFQLIVAMAGPT